MGGGSYDRDVYGGSSYSSWGTSSVSASKMSNTYLDDSIQPNNKIIKSTTKNPIIIALDVTGSNINFARLVYDKMPMFYGQIEQQGYLKDFDIAFIAIGDAYTDSYPLQVTDFAKGIEIDSWLEKLVLEGCGGGQRMETYELAAQYLIKNAEFNKDSEPILFFIGDEAPYPKVSKEHCDAFDIECENSYDPFNNLNKKFNNNVFMFLNKYSGRDFDNSITQEWISRLPSEHVRKIQEEKSIIDLMLGVIALKNGRTLKAYETDMLDRGQTKERLQNIRESLLGYANSKELSVIDKIDVSIPNIKDNPKTLGKRL